MAPLVEQINKELHTGTARLSKWIDQLSLSAGVAATFTFPTNVDTVEVTYPGSDPVYYRADGSAAVIPAAGKTDGTGSQQVINGRRYTIEPGQAVSFICVSNVVVSFAAAKAFVTG